MASQDKGYVKETTQGYEIYPQGKVSPVISIVLIVVFIGSVIRLGSTLKDQFNLADSWLDIVTTIVLLGLIALRYAVGRNQIIINTNQKVITLPTKKSIAFNDVRSLHFGFNVQTMKYGSVKVYNLVVMTNADKITVVETSDSDVAKSIGDKLSEVLGVPLQETKD